MDPSRSKHVVKVHVAFGAKTCFWFLFQLSMLTKRVHTPREVVTLSFEPLLPSRRNPGHGVSSPPPPTLPLRQEATSASNVFPPMQHPPVL